MSKFNLFTRSALQSMAAATGVGGAPAADADGAADPEAGPAPDEGDPVDDKPADKPVDEPADPDAAAEPVIDVVSVDDANTHASAQFAAGRKAERDRTAAVFASAEGKANPQMAAWMLGSSADASADAIVEQLKTMPAAAATPAAPAASIPDTDTDVGRGNAAEALGTGPDGDDVWAAVQNTAKTGAAPMSDAGSLSIAALHAGGRNLAAGSTSFTPPAVVPTGN